MINKVIKAALFHLNEMNNDTRSDVAFFMQNLRANGIKTALCLSPSTFLPTAQKLQVPPFHCVVFDETLEGIRAAKTNGMKNCGVKNPETKALADEFITNFSEIDLESFLESGRKSFYPANDYYLYEKSFHLGELNHIESMFALGNGYLGIRGTYEEEDVTTEGQEIPGMYINGVYATEDFIHPWFYKGYPKNEQFTVNLTDWRLVSVFIDGEKVCFSKGKMLEHQRMLNMKAGRLERSFIWESSSGKQISVRTYRIVSMKHTHTAAMCYCITPLNFDGMIEIRSEVRFVNTTKGKGFTEKTGVGSINHIQYVTLSIPSTDIQIAMAYTHEICFSKVGSDEPCFESRWTENIWTDNSHIYKIFINAEKNQAISLQKYVAFYSTNDNVNNIIESAAAAVRSCHQSGFDTFMQEQEGFWHKHWEIGDIKINGNANDDLAVRFNLFHVRQQIPTEGALSIGATGITGPQYSGKVFWDTEIYVMPYINYIDPALTKEMLMYRYRILDHAKNRAKEMDGKGALFAWASIDGNETSTCIEASTAEYHLQSDIAYAINRYYRSTNDKHFLYHYGAEILFETAAFMYHLGAYIPENDNHFCINGVCGPDEYAGTVNNNFYTNMMLRFHFNFAIEVYEMMKQERPDLLQKLKSKIRITEQDIRNWRHASDTMYPCYNERLGIFEQDASFLTKNPVDVSKLPQHVSLLGSETHLLNVWRMQLIKQADVILLLFLLGKDYTPEQKKANYDFYEPKTNHGSSLSPAVHSIIANEIGYKKDAYAYFRSSAYMDLCDFKHNTAGGLHMACLGGVWMTVANGYLGMRDYDDKLIFHPVIPDEWDSYLIHIVYRGSVLRIEVNHQQTIFILKKGPSVAFECYGKHFCLKDALTIPMHA